MFSEKVTNMCPLDKLKQLSKRIDDLIFMSSSIYFSSTKTDVDDLIEEIVEIAYRKGRADELYHSKGPNKSLY